MLSLTKIFVLVFVNRKETLVRVCFDSLKCHILSFKTVVGLLREFHIIGLMSKTEGKTNFSRRLKQFDSLI